ncbi:MAG: hypothetical protein AB7L13_04050 [Acidimicrobiia bacterium]
MSADWSAVVFGYVVAIGAIGGYAVKLVRRGRVLARQIPDQDKPWT